jgi:hypothetical protein
MSNSIVVRAAECERLAALDGRSFQVHVMPNNRLRLYPLEIEPPDRRYTVVVGGERCGAVAGHAGKHCWGGGD